MTELTPYLDLDAQRPEYLLEAGRRVYAIGDIHGRLDCIEHAFTLIDQDKAQNPVSEVTEITLGDYVDRGPHSAQVIDALIERQRTVGTICLMGNHDYEFLQIAKGHDTDSPFLLLGGRDTATSYGIDPSVDGDELQSELRNHVSTSHLEFLETLRSGIEIDNMFFVHAGIRPGVPLDQQTEKDMLWIRQPFLTSTEWLGHLIVHGHTPALVPQIKPNRIGIDTGAFMTGVLTVCVLERGGFRLLQSEQRPDHKYGKPKTRTSRETE